MTVKIYQTKDGREPFVEWYRTIERKSKVSAARVRERIRRIEQGNLGEYKSLHGGLFEVKFRFGVGYRIYFAEAGKNKLVILSGGEKRTQERDVDTARRYLNDYQNE